MQNNNKTFITVTNSILEELRVRAVENGRTLANELELRLVHSLERDKQMIREDIECAEQAFEVARFLSGDFK